MANGVGYDLITSHKAVTRYLGKVLKGTPIKSNFIK